MSCLAICSSKPLCLMTRYKQKQCQLFKAIDRLYFTPSLGKFLFQRKFANNADINEGLINHWAFTNNALDSAGTSHLYNGIGVSFTYDRFGSPNSALSLSSGYYQAQAGIYFNSGPFSVTAWINMRTVSYTARIIDFGSGPFGSNNIVFCVFLANSNTPTLASFDNSKNYPFLISKSSITLNQWYHLAATFDGNLGYVYLDGVLVASGPLMSPVNINRTSNYIGKSNLASDGLADGVYDEIRFYNRYMSANQILNIIQA